MDELKPETWTSSSTESLKLIIVDNLHEKARQFKPDFTYPIFGDDEIIYGFKDLVIYLVFDSVTFKPFLNVKFSEKMNEIDKDSIQGKLIEFLPQNDYILKDELKWNIECEKERETYELPSDSFKVNEYVLNENNSLDDAENNKEIKYSVYKTSIKENLKLHRRLQIFNIFFIEGASYIDENDPMWEIYYVFNSTTKECIGFSTVYKYWYYYNGFKQFDITNENYRLKISQFIILPPYQHKGHGSNLYDTIYENSFKDSSIKELIVESPNESFDDLRDVRDLFKLNLKRDEILKIVKEHNILEEGKNKEDEYNNFTAKYQDKFKIEKRQLLRCIEMLILQKINQDLKENAKSDDSINQKLYENQLLRRLYLQNYDTLVGMTIDEQKTALMKSMESITEDYKRLLKL